ncbi:MAG: hypothetical protein H5T64_01795 [Chloroflexi bacterium]|nr:hypothetical protein [Chloroflexota bacterium]
MSKHRLLGFAVAITIFLTLASVALADTYDLSWWTVDGGGYTFSSGGPYLLGGTIGQPDAGRMSGGAYSLSGGFWIGEEIPPVTGPYHVRLPIVLKNYGW